MLKHPHIVGVTREISGFGEGWEMTLIVLTNLELNPDAASYDAVAEESLLLAITDFMKQHPTLVDRVTVRNVPHA